MIKLRLFDKRYGRYLSPYLVGNMILDAINSKDYIPELSTGLYDKNEVEIFVGDVVMLGDIKTVVNYDVSIASFRLKSTLDDYALTIDKVQRLEVIGNINENGDLLK